MDKNIFAKNLSALDKKYPELASELRETRIEGSRYKITRSATGEPNLLVGGEKGFVMLYDPAGPFEHCRQYFDGMQIRHAPMVVFLGFGLGYHLQVFVKQYGERARTQKILVFEEDIRLFRLAMETLDFSSLILHPDLYLFVGKDPEEAFNRIRTGPLQGQGAFFHARSTKVLPLPAHILLNETYYRKALDVMRMAFRQTMVLAGNDPTDGFVGIDNLLGNIKHIVAHPGINQLRDRFKGKPAITVASGPSLEKNIHLLRELRDRALIIAVDSAFLALMKREIRPHIVASLERTAGTGKFYEGVPECEGVHLAFCPVVQPDVYDSFRGRKVIVFRPFSHFEWLRKDKGTLPIGPSVSNMAFAIAAYLGCDPIILVGQDLAFAEDGDTHIEDMLFGDRDETYYSTMIEVEGNYGKPVKTSRTWEIFRKAHEEDLDLYKGVCINATEGGAKIRGTRVMSLSEAIGAYCREDFFPERIIADSVSDFERSVNVPAELSFMLDRCTGTRTALERMGRDLLEYRLEILEVQARLIRPFMYEGKDVDGDYLLTVAQKYLGILKMLAQNADAHDIMAHTIQPLLVWFTNRINYLKEIYSDSACLHAQQLLMIKDWLGAVGQLFVSTIDALEKAEATITEELKKTA